MAVEAVIPLDSNGLLIAFSILVILASLYYGQKNKWKASNYFVIIVPLILFIGIVFLAPLPNLSGEEFEGYDYEIRISARIKPWTYNVTEVIDKNTGAILPPTTEIGGHPVSVAETLSSKYGGDGGEIAYRNVTLVKGYVYKLVFEAIDTDHGLHINGLTDYKGNEVDANLPQHKPIAFYIDTNLVDVGSYKFFCNFFCGAGHGLMISYVNVVPPATS